MADTKQDDVTLVRLIAEGETAALSELYDRYNRLVFSIALAVVGDEATAAEITLDVFTRVWQRAGSYRPEQAKVTTWLTAITRHHSIDVLRRQGVRPEAHSISWDGLPPQAAAHDLEEDVELAWQRRRVRAAVAQLPAEQQEVLALAYFKGYSHQQIANVLKQPLGTVKTRIRSAMQKLRQLLAEERPSPDKSTDASAAYYNDESK
jgi:RNA polymerase sigma-70 factor (ECF subfamily)